MLFCPVVFSGLKASDGTETRSHAKVGGLGGEGIPPFVVLMASCKGGGIGVISFFKARLGLSICCGQGCACEHNRHQPDMLRIEPGIVVKRTTLQPPPCVF
jgi:hypothetical protein